MRALLDTNFVIALIDANHVFHSWAHEWWAENSGFGWGSCPITENGVVRIMSGSGYSKEERFTPREILDWLDDFISATDHQFWFDDVSFRDKSLFFLDSLIGHRQLTDVYLLALAVRNGGRLVTFDRRLQTASVLGATAENLVVVSGRSSS